ncbi:MAG: hypothetical protein SVK08_02085 [Halobacteriota archaeon]|nr:hypothetical protein [Halobacteriota archaeon]
MNTVEKYRMLRDHLRILKREVSNLHKNQKLSRSHFIKWHNTLIIEALMPEEFQRTGKELLGHYDYLDDPEHIDAQELFSRSYDPETSHVRAIVFTIENMYAANEYIGKHPGFYSEFLNVPKMFFYVQKNRTSWAIDELGIFESIDHAIKYAEDNEIEFSLIVDLETVEEWYDVLHCKFNGLPRKWTCPLCNCHDIEEGFTHASGRSKLKLDPEEGYVYDNENILDKMDGEVWVQCAGCGETLPYASPAELNEKLGYQS